MQDSLNDTISRLGEIQADDGKVRTTALNLPAIAEEVEPLLTDGPVQAVNAAGAQQVGLVNAAGDAKVAELEAVLTSQNAIDAIAARDDAEIAKDIAESSAILAQGYAGTAQGYANTALQAKNSAQVHAQVAVDAAASIPLIVGPVGPAGPQGQQGNPGVAGQQGIQGVQGPAGNAWIYQGEYNGGVTYNTNDYVTFYGSSYVLKNFIGAAGYDPIGYPGSWQLVAQKGDTGANGADGADGLGVVNWRGEFNGSTFYFSGDVVTYEGSSYAESMQGSGSNQGNYPFVGSAYWTLVAQAGSQGVEGPQGQPGQNGQDGATGPAGPSIAEWDSGTTYYTGNAATYNNAIFVCVSGGITGGSYPPDSANWTLASSNYFAYASTVIGKVNRSGDTFNGKVNFTPVAGVAGLNIGIGGTSAGSSVNGDMWIVSGGNNLNFRDATGAVKVVAALSNGNVFSAVQTIDVTSTSPALRVTQKGTGNVLLVEDAINPDTTALVVEQSGNVGIGVATGFAATAKLEVVGNTKSTTISTGSGPTISLDSTTSHTGGGDTLDLLITINGVQYRIGLRPA